MRINDSVASAEIAAAAMQDKGLDPENDLVTRTDFVRRVTLLLRGQRASGYSIDSLTKRHPPG
jgi:hypothetical protein